MSWQYSSAGQPHRAQSGAGSSSAGSYAGEPTTMASTSVSPGDSSNFNFAALTGSPDIEAALDFAALGLASPVSQASFGAVDLQHAMNNPAMNMNLGPSASGGSQPTSIEELFGLVSQAPSYNPMFAYNPGPPFMLQGMDTSFQQPQEQEQQQMSIQPAMSPAMSLSSSNAPSQRQQQQLEPVQKKKRSGVAPVVQQRQDPRTLMQPTWTPPGPKIEPCDADGVHVPFDPEIVYITDADGNFLSIEDHSWNRFLTTNTNDGQSQQSLSIMMPGASTSSFETLETASATSTSFTAMSSVDGDMALQVSQLPSHLRESAYPNILDHNLFTFLTSPPLAHFTRHILRLVLKSGKPIRYKWFCDSPEYERKMEMRVARLRGLGGVEGVVWTSKIVWERPHQGIGVGYLKRKSVSEPDERELEFARDLETASSAESMSTPGVGAASSTFESTVSSSAVDARTPSLSTTLTTPSILAGQELTTTRSIDGPLTVCSFCKRILVPLALVPTECMPNLLESLSQHNTTPMPIPTEPSPDSPQPVPVFGLRGKRGLHPLSLSSPLPKALWLTPWEYYILAKQQDREGLQVRHGVCGGCFEEMCEVVKMPGWVENGRRLWGGM